MDKVLSSSPKYEIELECTDVVAETSYLVRSMLLKCKDLIGTGQDSQVSRGKRSYDRNYNERSKRRREDQGFREQPVRVTQSGLKLDDNFIKGIQDLHKTLVQPSSPYIPVMPPQYNNNFYGMSSHLYG